jgi:hypothetical protein
MNIKLVSNGLTRNLARQALKLRKHSPVLLFGAGIVGVIGTAILASKATLKLDEALKETRNLLDDVNNAEITTNYSASDQTQDRLYIYIRATTKMVRLYAPAIGVGVLTVGALTGSHVVLSRRNVAMTAAYAALDKGWREYRQRVVDQYGIDKDRELRYNLQDHKIAKDGPEGVELQTIKQIGDASCSVYARMFDEACGSRSWSRDPGYNQLFLSAQQNYANDLLKARGYVFLNDVYEMLGLSHTSAGQIVGWIYNPSGDHGGDNYIDFGIFDGDRHSGMRFVKGYADSILLDFNVDGIIWDKI